MLSSSLLAFGLVARAVAQLSDVSPVPASGPPGGTSGGSSSLDALISPDFTPFLWTTPLNIMPIAEPLATFTGVNGTIDFFQYNITAFTLQIYPNLGPTTFTGYGGITPGHTFQMTRGRQAVVRFINKYTNPSSIHLHGSYSRAPWDGWAEDVTNPGQFKDYYYPNGQPQRTLWYHDHAIGITAVNAYFGQAGFYELIDPILGQFGLPTGEFDVPLMLVAKYFNTDGTLMSPIDERVSQYGDIIMVNGFPYPFFEVQPRKYRFRLLDAGVSRTFSLFLSQDLTPATLETFTVVGSDTGFLSAPVNTTNLVIAVAERYEIVIDFAPFIGKNVTLRNEQQFQTNPDYLNTDLVLKFIVGDVVLDNTNNGPIPPTLATIPEPPVHLTVDHHFTFERDGQMWMINGVGFEDITNRVLAKPAEGSVERWILTNKSAGWMHPIHIHLIDFQVVSRTGGRGIVEPYEANGLKDVVYLGTGEEIELTAFYQPWSGVYMFHCHNLVHEDHDMMASFNTTEIDLSAFGYPDNVTFTDPLSPIWRAKEYPGFTDLDQVQNVLLPMFANLNAYPSENAEGVEGFENALAAFYAENGPVVDPKPVSPLLIPDAQNGEGAYKKRSIIDATGAERRDMTENPAMALRAPRRGLIPEQ
jgi:bilirubin oxidase